MALAQEAENPNDQIRRLRFRRPRPKVVGVSNEEGVQQGRPIPLAAIPRGRKRIHMEKIKSTMPCLKVQGDQYHLGCVKPPIDIKTKVPF